MTQQDIFEFLRDNLRVTITNSISTDHDYGSDRYVGVKSSVEVFLTNPTTGEEECISSDWSTDSVSI